MAIVRRVFGFSVSVSSARITAANSPSSHYHTTTASTMPPPRTPRPPAMAPAQMMINGLEAERENAGTKKSPLQIQMLERFYSEVQYPTPEDMAEYATSVGLAYSQVRIWFKERRRKERRREMEAIGAHVER